MSNLCVEKNKVVFFTYRVTDENGKLMEQYDLPVGYVHGVDNDLLPKLESALEGHVAGDKIKVKLSPADGFGESDPNLIYRYKIDNVPPEFRHVGAEPQFQNENGETRTFTVTRVKNGKVTMDGNHPYAGKTIVFIITITEIRDADNDEIASGKPKDADSSVVH